VINDDQLHLASWAKTISFFSLSHKVDVVCICLNVAHYMEKRRAVVNTVMNLLS